MEPGGTEAPAHEAPASARPERAGCGPGVPTTIGSALCPLPALDPTEQPDHGVTQLVPAPRATPGPAAISPEASPGPQLASVCVLRPAARPLLHSGLCPQPAACSWSQRQRGAALPPPAPPSPSGEQRQEGREAAAPIAQLLQCCCAPARRPRGPSESRWRARAGWVQPDGAVLLPRCLPRCLPHGCPTAALTPCSAATAACGARRGSEGLQGVGQSRLSSPAQAGGKEHGEEKGVERRRAERGAGERVREGMGRRSPARGRADPLSRHLGAAEPRDVAVLCQAHRPARTPSSCRVVPSGTAPELRGRKGKAGRDEMPPLQSR